METEITNPRDFAKKLIDTYVLRGDSIESLKAGQQGWSWTGFSVAIGGCAWKDNKLIHKGKSDEIIVSRFEGEECCHIFKLKELFDEIKVGQLSLI